MANEQNLIPFNKMTEKEQREIASKGGKASGEARAKRKTLKEELLLLLSEGHLQENITLALVKEALEGSNKMKAYEVIRDTIGEKPVDKVENEIISTIKVDVVDE